MTAVNNNNSATMQRRSPYYLNAGAAYRWPTGLRHGLANSTQVYSKPDNIADARHETETPNYNVHPYPYFQQASGTVTCGALQPTPKSDLTSEASAIYTMQTKIEPGGLVIQQKPSTGDPARPPYSYIALIAMCIDCSPTRRAKLSEICQFIRDSFTYYQKKCKHRLNNVIRHTLSINKCFVKLPLEKGELEKGHYWTLDSGSLHMFDNGGFRRRKSIYKKGYVAKQAGEVKENGVQPDQGNSSQDTYGTRETLKATGMMTGLVAAETAPPQSLPNFSQTMISPCTPHYPTHLHPMKENDVQPYQRDSSQDTYGTRKTLKTTGMMTGLVAAGTPPLQSSPNFSQTMLSPCTPHYLAHMCPMHGHDALQQVVFPPYTPTISYVPQHPVMADSITTGMTVASPLVCPATTRSLPHTYNVSAVHQCMYPETSGIISTHSGTTVSNHHEDNQIPLSISPIRNKPCNHGRLTDPRQYPSCVATHILP